MDECKGCFPPPNLFYERDVPTNMERAFDVTVGGSPESEGGWGLIAKQNFLVLDGEVEQWMTVIYPCGIAGKITKLNKYSNGTFMEVGSMSCNYLPGVEFGSVVKVIPVV
jgi:hypothetical protein